MKNFINFNFLFCISTSKCTIVVVGLCHCLCQVGHFRARAAEKRRFGRPVARITAVCSETWVGVLQVFFSDNGVAPSFGAACLILSCFNCNRRRVISLCSFVDQAQIRNYAARDFIIGYVFFADKSAI